MENILFFLVHYKVDFYNKLFGDKFKINIALTKKILTQCNFPAEKIFVPLYAYNSSNYNKNLFITKLVKRNRISVLEKIDESYISIEIGYAKALDMLRFFHSLSLDAISKTFCNEECVTLNKLELEKRKFIFSFEWIDSINKPNETPLPPK